jgi:BirA family biotin operon repressor/biotin-[acetyl-CoA-carboxylase] ligase
VGFTAYCAVKCAEALEQLCSVPVGIKWVNDLYLRDRKLGGIITHGSLSPDGRILSHMTVGIGVNIRNELPPELAGIAISLKEAGSPLPSPEELGREIASRILDGRAEFLSDSVLQGYRERMLLLGKRVTVYSAEREFFATVLGVNPDYSLKILAEDGVVWDLYSGEISVREDSSTNIPVFKK